MQVILVGYLSHTFYRPYGWKGMIARNHRMPTDSSSAASDVLIPCYVTPQNCVPLPGTAFDLIQNQEFLASMVRTHRSDQSNKCLIYPPHHPSLPTPHFLLSFHAPSPHTLPVSAFSMRRETFCAWRIYPYLPRSGSLSLAPPSKHHLLPHPPSPFPVDT